MHDARFLLLGAIAAVALVAPLLLRRRLSPRRLLLGALALGLATAFIVRSGALTDLTADRLARARDRWSRHATVDYDLEVLVHADRLEDASFEIRVRDGQVQQALQNGIATTGTAEAYTVSGLFEILERELELASDPGAGFGAPEGYRAYLKVRFDPDLGYPQKYQRSVGGTTNGVEITVVRFAPGG
jgi:hypothetical protein